MSSRRRVQQLRLLIVVALASLVGVLFVSTASHLRPETRVRDFSIITPTTVGADGHVSPGGTGFLRHPQSGFVSATGAATNTAGLSDDVIRLADSHLTGSGETVLGHYADDYIGLAQSRGASYFDIGDAYNGLTPAQQWAANQRVLDTAIANGDRITLATSRLSIRPGSPLASEISYLTGPAGNYQWLDDVTLVPAG